MQYDPQDLEQDLRAHFSPDEYRELVEQLEAALCAIESMRIRVPEILEVFFKDARLLSTRDISEQTHSALHALVDELHAARVQRPVKPIASRDALRLAYSERMS